MQMFFMMFLHIAVLYETPCSRLQLNIKEIILFELIEINGLINFN